MIALYVLLTAVTAVFSYLHGRDHVSKGYLVAGEALVGGLAGLLLAGWFGLLGVLISPLYWFLFRTSSQATAELDFMSRVSDDIKAVVMAYILPISVCNALILIGAIYTQAWFCLLLVPLCVGSVALVYFTARAFRNDDGEKASDNRWPVEVANGSVLAVLVGAL